MATKHHLRRSVAVMRAIYMSRLLAFWMVEEDGVVVKTVRVRNEVWKRSLADVLDNPPKFPEMKDPAVKKANNLKPKAEAKANEG